MHVHKFIAVEQHQCNLSPSGFQRGSFCRVGGFGLSASCSRDSSESVRTMFSISVRGRLASEQQAVGKSDPARDRWRRRSRLVRQSPVAARSADGPCNIASACNGTVETGALRAVDFHQRRVEQVQHRQMLAAAHDLIDRTATARFVVGVDHRSVTLSGHVRPLAERRGSRYRRRQPASCREPFRLDAASATRLRAACCRDRRLFRGIDIRRLAIRGRRHDQRCSASATNVARFSA